MGDELLQGSGRRRVAPPLFKTTFTAANGTLWQNVICEVGAFSSTHSMALTSRAAVVAQAGTNDTLGNQGRRQGTPYHPIFNVSAVAVTAEVSTPTWATFRYCLRGGPTTSFAVCVDFGIFAPGRIDIYINGTLNVTVTGLTLANNDRFKIVDDGTNNSGCIKVYQNNVLVLSSTATPAQNTATYHCLNAYNTVVRLDDIEVKQ